MLRGQRVLTAWRQLVNASKTNSKIEKERVARHHLLSQLSGQARRLLFRIQGEAGAANVLTSLICWRFLVASQRMQRALQQLSVEQEVALDELSGVNL